jgi:hypothetical protein
MKTEPKKTVTICTIKEVQNIIENCSDKKAQRMIALCRDALGKEKPKILSLDDFKDYFEIE